MNIDWFTFSAQIINFLILIWLLKKVLYRPVLRVIRQREESISAQLEAARQDAELARSETVRLEEMRRNFDLEAARELEQARLDAQKIRDDLLAAARNEAEAERKRWFNALEREKQDFLRRLGRLTATSFQTLAARALLDLADDDLEARLLLLFRKKLVSLPEQERLAIGRTLQQDNSELRVTSAAPLSPAARHELSETFKQLWAEDHAVQFKVDSSLLAGIELVAGGKKISWDLRVYLHDFARELERSLAQEG